MPEELKINQIAIDVDVAIGAIGRWLLMLTGYRFNKNETRCQNDNQSEVSSYDLGQ